MVDANFFAGVACGAAITATFCLHIFDATSNLKEAEKTVAPQAEVELIPGELVAPSPERIKEADSSVSVKDNDLLFQDNTPSITESQEDSTGGQFDRQERNHNWAHFTETAVQDFLATHDLGSHFTIEEIECRTSLCKLRIIGIDGRDIPKWQQIIQDLKVEPWNRFQQSGWSLYEEEGHVVIIQTLQSTEQTQD